MVIAVNSSSLCILARPICKKAQTAPTEWAFFVPIREVRRCHIQELAKHRGNSPQLFSEPDLPSVSPRDFIRLHRKDARGRRATTSVSPYDIRTVAHQIDGQF